MNLGHENAAQVLATFPLIGRSSSSSLDKATNISSCPESFADWYCLNGATCFQVKIEESILYNCWCASGYSGLRCDYKYSRTSNGLDSNSNEFPDWSDNVLKNQSVSNIKDDESATKFITKDDMLVLKRAPLFGRLSSARDGIQSDSFLQRSNFIYMVPLVILIVLSVSFIIKLIKRKQCSTSDVQPSVLRNIIEQPMDSSDPLNCDNDQTELTNFQTCPQPARALENNNGSRADQQIASSRHDVINGLQQVSVLYNYEDERRSSLESTISSRAASTLPAHYRLNDTFVRTFCTANCN